VKYLTSRIATLTAQIESKEAEQPEVTDEMIKEWAIELVMKEENYPDMPYRAGLFAGAKAMRDGLIK
jgi:hypothetical protein